MQTDTFKVPDELDNFTFLVVSILALSSSLRAAASPGELGPLSVPHLISKANSSGFSHRVTTSTRPGLRECSLPQTG